MTRLFALLAALAWAAAGCTPARAPEVAGLSLTTADGTRAPIGALLHERPLTIVTFFSAHCPCQRTHDARLRELIARDTARGVTFLVVDSEESTTDASLAEESRSRGYPIWRDAAGQLARSLDAEYATFSVLLDPSGKVLYRGGFDSDKSHLKENRTPYLADAIDDALAHRPLRKTEAKALGCALELR